MLVGAECDELLRVQNFYSVTKLYRRSFLNAHSIRFEEGRIYEDNPFVSAGSKPCAESFARALAPLHD